MLTVTPEEVAKRILRSEPDRLGIIRNRLVVLVLEEVSIAPAVVGVGKVGVYSNRLAAITIRLRTEEVSCV